MRSAGTQPWFFVSSDDAFAPASFSWHIDDKLSMLVNQVQLIKYCIPPRSECDYGMQSHQFMPKNHYMNPIISQLTAS